MGDKNFDKMLQMRKSRSEYLADKSKAGRSSSTAGRPRPYARHNMLAALLYSPRAIGRTYTVTPKHRYEHFAMGKLYAWKITDAGVGTIMDASRSLGEMTADELRKHFVIKYHGDE